MPADTLTPLGARALAGMVVLTSNAGIFHLQHQKRLCDIGFECMAINCYCLTTGELMADAMVLCVTS